MKSVALALSLAFLSNIVIAQEPAKSPLNGKTSELQKQCVENPKACEDQKAQRKQKHDVRKAWCQKHLTACEELKPIQAQAASPEKRKARQTWCQKYTTACAELKQINQTTPQSKP
jgi:hypothetical protein